MVDVPELQDLRSRCFLKTSAALDARINSHQFVVSGDRLCQSFDEGLSLSQLAARTRIGIQTAAPWRTSSSKVATAAATWLGHALLPTAGSLDWYVEAAQTFAKLGFVAVLGALGQDQISEFRRACQRIADEMLAFDTERIGNRGPRRYSYGGASRSMHMMHVHPWPQLLENRPVRILLETIYPKGYTAAGGGGDFVLGSTDTYQSLHLDIGSGAFNELERPPAIAVNFVVEDLACDGGPVRVIPGSQWQNQAPPPLYLETIDAKAAILCPLPAGTAIVRDLRTWHGGTPNTLRSTRYLPNLEFVDGEWAHRTCGKGGYLDPCGQILPASAHARLSVAGQSVSRGIVDASGALEEIDATGNGDLRVTSWLDREFAQFTRHSADSY